MKTSVNMNRVLVICLLASLSFSLFLWGSNRNNQSSSNVVQAQAVTIPAGMVVAFDLASCPSGWTEYTAGRGRAIIGTNPSAGGGISARALGATGGAETHTLTTSEMPSHSHVQSYYRSPSIYGWTVNTWNPGAFYAGDTAAVGNVQDSTANAGGGGAHNNMQPFVALLHCQKD
jgi:hypothetical protein